MGQQMDPLVGIVLLTHRRPGMLGRAIDSIIHQTYEPWETLIIANGCGPPTRDILDEVSDDDRFRICWFERKLGISEARNRGIDRVEGEYVAFLDDDDEWLPEKLERQVRFLEDHPEASIVSCRHYTILNQLRFPSGTPGWVDLDDLLYRNSLGSPTFCTVRHEDLVNVRINNSLSARDDHDLWLRVLRKSGKKGYVLREPLAQYHRHQEERVTDADYRVILEASEIIIDTFSEEMDQEHKLFRRSRREINSSDFERSFFARFGIVLNFLRTAPEYRVDGLIRLAGYLFGFRNSSLFARARSLFHRILRSR